MDNPLASEIVCPKCNAPIAASDNFCRQCGTPTATGAGSSGGTRGAWWESPWIVLPLIFVVLGPFALPLLWRSRCFSRAWKIVLSVLVVGIAAYALWQIWYIFDQALAPLRDLKF